MSKAIQYVLNHLANGSRRVVVVPTGDIEEGYFEGMLYTVTAGWTVVNREHGAEFELPWTAEYFASLDLLVRDDTVYIYPKGMKK